MQYTNLYLILMIRSTLLSISIILLSGTLIFADKVDETTAQKAALQVYLEHSDHANLSPDILNTYFYVPGQETALYVFTFVQGGFVIISADDAAWPSPGFSLKGDFTYEISSPAFNAWMEGYIKQIEYIRVNKLEANDNIRNEWERLTKSDNTEHKSSSKAVSPMLTCTWNQGSYYNAYCPVDSAGPSNHALTGCVATAMAQIMYYYRYPLQGTGSHSYYAYSSYGSYGYLSVNFGNTTYHWEEMVNNIGNKPNDEMAQLQYHCGVSVEMGYGPNASGASSWNVVGAMKNYFGYSGSLQLKTKGNYSETQWTQMLVSNLDAGMPMYYHGYSSSSGHAFVCDGYQGTDYFHFNWGWGGSYDGYYYVNNLNPGYDFTSGQGAIFDIYPGSNYPYYCSGPKTLNVLRGTLEDGSGPEDYGNNMNCSWLISPSDTIVGIDLEFTRFNTASSSDVLTVYDGETTSAAVLGSFTGSNIPSMVSSTGDKMLITFTTNGSGTSDGWFAEFKAIPAEFCATNVVLTDASGSLSDGSGSYNYNDMTTCNWTIEPPGATSITLSFNKFETEPTLDFLKIYDASTSPSTLLATYSGNSIPPQVLCNSGKMFIVFFANNSNTYDGWSATYSSAPLTVDEYQNNDILVYPNPVSDILYLDMSSISSKDKIIRVFSTNGQEVYVAHIGDAEKWSIQTGDLPKGLYMIKLLAEDESVFRKFIKN